MTRGDFPWRNLRPSEVRRIAMAGFNVAEIAHIAGVPLDVADVMRREALGIPLPTTFASCPQVFGVRLAA